MGARDNRLIFAFVMLLLLMAKNIPQAEGASDAPTCRPSQAEALLPALFTHWNESNDGQKAEAALELSRCLIESGFRHGATVILAATVEQAPGEFHGELSRIWLPLEMKIGPAPQSIGGLNQAPLLNVHRRERSRQAFLSGLSRFEAGSFAAAIEDLAGVSGAERGIAQLLLGDALRETHAYKEALTAYHGSLSSFDDDEDRSNLLKVDLVRRSKEQKSFQSMAKKAGLPSLQFPTDSPPLPSGWLIPEPHAQARMGLGHAANALGEPKAARAYFVTLFDHPALGAVARLNAGNAAISSSSIATALSDLEPLSRQTNLSALQAQLLLRQMTPEKKAQGILYERSRSLYQRLENELLPIQETLENTPRKGLELLQVQEKTGKGPYSEELLLRLQTNTQLHLLRTRLHQVEVETIGLLALVESPGSNAFLHYLKASFEGDQELLAKACALKIQEEVNAYYLELLDAKKQIPPSDIRDALFTPLYILTPSQ